MYKMSSSTIFAGKPVYGIESENDNIICDLD